MGKLRQEIAASLPPRLHLPDEFTAAIDWMDKVGAVGRMTYGDKLYGALDPRFVGAMGGSCICFEATDPDHAHLWINVDESQETARLAPIVRTGYDGSYAALWLDDDDRQQIVHLGSGSGSMMTGIMTRSPLDFLRLLAIGYEELCDPYAFDKTPIEAAMNPDVLKPPTRFRTWLTATYGVTIPHIGAEVIRPPSDMAEPSNDPFCHWLDRIRS